MQSISFCNYRCILLSACANTTRSGVVGVNRSQFLVVSAFEVDRLSAISYNEQNQKAKEKGLLITSGPEYDRLKTISNCLIAQTGIFRDDTNQWNWQLVLINAPILNATCAPGGKITFYTGIIEQLNLTDDEIAAIMGHEIAHALREHGRERLSQAMAQSAVTNIAMAAAGGMDLLSTQQIRQLNTYWYCPTQDKTNLKRMLLDWSLQLGLGTTLGQLLACGKR